MSRDETVSFSLEVNVGAANAELRKMQTILYRSLSLADRLGLANTADIRQRIALLNQLRLAYKAVQAARMAAGDPLAWALALLSVAEVAVSLGEEFTRETVGSEGPSTSNLTE